jgi:hypothetical protein|tara:strand:+ start:11831 stop:11995 length:165 start_codon:yes stop_codon:yes gene_type:complete
MTKLEGIAERVADYMAYDVGLPTFLAFEFIVGRYSWEEVREIWKDTYKRDKIST